MLLARCDHPCIHGVCVGMNVCQCDQGWNGKLCEAGKFRNNLATISAKNDNFLVDLIQSNLRLQMNFLSAICRRRCFKGACVAPNKCKCKTGWTGRYCTDGKSQNLAGKYGKRKRHFVCVFFFFL